MLRDLLAADAPMPRVRLTQIFRQAQQSGVVTNAHRINAGELPLTRGLRRLLPLRRATTPRPTAELTVDVVASRIPAKFGLDPRRDVQVLAPMHRGPAGAGALNELLQAGADARARRACPSGGAAARVFRVGDKVTQIRNNYDKGAAGVFNGTVGVVTALSTRGAAS